MMSVAERVSIRVELLISDSLFIEELDRLISEYLKWRG